MEKKMKRSKEVDYYYPFKRVKECHPQNSKRMFVNYFILFISIVTFLNQNFIISTIKAERPDLYSQVDDVIRLNSTTFEPVVYHQNRNVTYMVQFYNTFCGHCQMFAPIYKELATRVKNWASVVRIAAIDCSKDENVVTCSENKIEGYPTIYIFPPNSFKDEPNDKPTNLRSLETPWTVDDIEDTIVNYMVNLTSNRQEYPLVANALEPIKEIDLRQVKRLYQNIDDEISGNNGSDQDFMCIIETQGSYLGKKLILEYYRINSKLELRIIPLSNIQLIKSLLTDEDYSKLYENQPLLIKINGPLADAQSGYPSNRKAQVLVKGEEGTILPTSPEHERLDFIQKRFKTFFEHYYTVELENNLINSKDPITNLKDPNYRNNNNQIDQDPDLDDLMNMLRNNSAWIKKIFAIDILKGISYMITHEIKVKGDINPKEYETIRNLLTILKKYLILQKWDTGLYNFVDDLRTRLDDNRSEFEKNGVKAQQMRDMMDLAGGDAIRLKFNRENWVSCFDSDRLNKGYTCSLWLIFHSLTVGEYSKAPPARSRPLLVLTTMRDYITKFLGCTVCASNFEKETEQLESSIISRNSSVLWLWATHNRINQRLNNEKGNEKRPLIDVIFPRKDYCQGCIKTDLREIGLDGKTLDDIDWDRSKVFNYLLDTYKPDKIVSPEEMGAFISRHRKKYNYELDGSGRLIASPGGIDMNKSVEQWNLQGLFSTSDISLCLFLYLACIVMVAIVCVSLKPRWKRFKTKQ